jgi:hypothetical protein
MTLNVEIYEVNYAVSPGGIDCWEVNIQGYGNSSTASDFKTAGEALNWILDRYPEQLLELTVISQSYYQKELADA